MLCPCGCVTAGISPESADSVHWSPSKPESHASTQVCCACAATDNKAWQCLCVADNISVGLHGSQKLLLGILPGCTFTAVLGTALLTTAAKVAMQDTAIELHACVLVNSHPYVECRQAIWQDTPCCLAPNVAYSQVLSVHHLPVRPQGGARRVIAGRTAQQV